MWRIVVFEEHGDDNPIESANLRHVSSPTKWNGFSVTTGPMPLPSADLHLSMLHHPTTMDSGDHRQVCMVMKNHGRHEEIRSESERVKSGTNGLGI